MSKVNYHGNGKKYDKRHKERKSCGEILYDSGWWIPACDVKWKRRIDRRKIRHQKINEVSNFE